MACQDGVFNTLVYRSRVMAMEVSWCQLQGLPQGAGDCNAFVVGLSDICSLGLYPEAQRSITSALLSFKALVWDRRDTSAALCSGGYWVRCGKWEVFNLLELLVSHRQANSSQQTWHSPPRPPTQVYVLESSTTNQHCLERGGQTDSHIEIYSSNSADSIRTILVKIVVLIIEPSVELDTRCFQNWRSYRHAKTWQRS